MKKIILAGLIAFCASCKVTSKIALNRVTLSDSLMLESSIETLDSLCFVVLKNAGFHNYSDRGTHNYQDSSLRLELDRTHQSREGSPDWVANWVELGNDLYSIYPATENTRNSFISITTGSKKDKIVYKAPTSSIAMKPTKKLDVKLLLEKIKTLESALKTRLAKN